MKIKYYVPGAAAVLSLLLAGCTTTESTGELTKITTTEPGHSTDPTRSGEKSGIGFERRF